MTARPQQMRMSLVRQKHRLTMGVTPLLMKKIPSTRNSKSRRTDTAAYLSGRFECEFCLCDGNAQKIISVGVLGIVQPVRRFLLAGPDYRN